MITLYLLLWLAPISLNVYADRHGRKPDYLVMFFLRGIVAIAHNSLLFQPETLLQALPVFMFQVTSFWLIFEAWLNIVRDKPLLYFDTRENDSGWLDGFFAKRSILLHLTAKVICLILLILSICVIYYTH